MQEKAKLPPGVFSEERLGTGTEKEKEEKTMKKLVERFAFYLLRKIGRSPVGVDIGEEILFRGCWWLVVLPEVPEADWEAFVDGLHDYFQEAANYDPSVGIFGMREGEAELAKALMDALNRQEAKDDSQ